jgi:hypothetical protein
VQNKIIKIILKRRVTQVGIKNKMKKFFFKMIVKIKGQKKIEGEEDPELYI